ncbi:hypothetical protein H8M03_01145 [Sphingomonas sabuli]|uniref:Uncharacterized protein n=1 Tax=Sphingomonas sabuli TaxID=2764186 RepID=A0A7G9L302_9SPHN|nr:hypothetical protein [Sphingomonas sabuli]QNM83001.1 hypothetical protein H8M03_01145 [Sphingomonas sabuli]
MTSAAAGAQSLVPEAQSLVRDISGGRSAGDVIRDELARVDLPTRHRDS